ncbi:MAG TPA: RES family NAD+ phosphorylase [Candidatus Cybelea sp.]|nr:RES family NAD+ phosphorylase [Candidatus Cybelea sp.]
MTRVRWAESYRIIQSRFPFVGIFDRISDPNDLPAVLVIEARTNDRILEEAGAIALVRAKDRVSGPGATPVMAAFTHTKPSRFSDGSFGVYYAARHLPAAVAESKFHTECFYRATNEASAGIDMRVYAARINGNFDDLRVCEPSDSRLNPDSYEASQEYARQIYDADRLDGIVYPSVRDVAHRPAVACFRPTTIRNCYSHSYLLYRWDGLARKIVDVHKQEASGFAGTG